MPFATMRQMIEIGETEANLDEKGWSALQKFLISSENFDSVNGRDSNRNSISMWHHYNQQDRFVVKISRYKEKIQIFSSTADQLILPIVVRYYEQKYV